MIWDYGEHENKQREMDTGGQTINITYLWGLHTMNGYGKISTLIISVLFSI